MSGGKTKVAIFSLFAIALLGGGAVGLLASRYVPAQKPAPASAGQSLSEALQLSPQQQASIRKIWEQMRDQTDKSYLDADAINHQRDNEVLKLLNEEQTKKFNQIQQDYSDRYAKVLADRQAAFKDAVEKTKQLLNDEQRKKYEEILADRMGQKAAEREGLPADHLAPGTTSLTSGQNPLASPG